MTSEVAFAGSPPTELSQLFPDRVGDFKRVRAAGPTVSLKQQGVLNPKEGSSPLGGEAEYLGRDGEKFLVEMVRFHQDVEAYELLTVVSALARDKQPGIEIGTDNGTAGFAGNGQINFFKGLNFVRVSSLKPYHGSSSSLNTLARALSESLDKGEGDIPVLVKHLPNPEQAQKNAVYLSRFTSLQSLIPQQSVLTVVETGGNADAVIATFGLSKVLIVEFNTPQLASENDQRIIARIQELWKQGQLAPTAYRRVGNYSVFVFDAPDEPTAKQLIDQVRYEQVVQWLGENPYLLKEAERLYIDTTLGVFIAVMKASGYALIGCLGMGGLIGVLLFVRRRAQQRDVEAFSDAGGMLRLNLDELTPKTDPARLLRDRN